jgi:tubulin gamma
MSRMNDLSSEDGQFFKRLLDQYDRLRKRSAFLEQYKKEKNFELSEFDDARCVGHVHLTEFDELRVP